MWVRRREGTLEVRLHFEGTSESNARYLGELSGSFAATVASLGAEVAAERWTGSWTRVHQGLPFSDLDEDLLMVVSGRLAQMVRVLEPAVRDISRSQTSPGAED